MRYLLDTCMLVALLQRELGSERIREKILFAPSGSLALSAISAADLERHRSIPPQQGRQARL